MPRNEMTRRAAFGAAGAAVATAAVATAAVGMTSAVAAEERKGGALKLFDKVDASRTTRGARPIVFYPASDSHIVFKTQDELKAWEDEVRTRLGVELKGTLGTATESCSAGCTDDCDQ